MADGSAHHAFHVEAQAATLAWRRPAWAWALLTFTIGALWPLAFLSRENGLAQLAAISVGLALLLAFGALSLAIKLNRAPRLRRTIVIYVMAAAALIAIFIPFVFVGLDGLLAGMSNTADPTSTSAASDGGMRVAGIGVGMAWALAPLAFAVAAPSALAAGFALAFFGFRKERKPAVQDGPDLIVARRVPEITHDTRARRR